MGQIGFDNDKYLAMQSAHIRERISKFGGKLYLEFGGKLFDDFHASRVLPGFQPDSKIRMLQQLRDDAEIVIAVNANDIEKNKVRGDLGITYDDDCLRLIDAFRSLGLYVGGVCITQYAGQNAADAFIKRLNTLGVRNYRHYPIAGYPSDVAHIVSDEGFGRNEYIETTHSLIVVTAPGPGSGKMATCLSQLYHEHKHGVSAGYAKFETFPIWNLPLKHPVNLAYEAATADLDDVNMIDPFHLEAYGETTVNYNRDVEIFPVLRAIFERISGKCPYQSPTDMGVNMAGNCIIDDEVCRQASRMEILRRYYTAQVDVARGIADACQLRKLELVMQQADVTPDLCPAVAAAKQKAEETGAPAGAMVLPDGRVVTGKTSSLLGASAALLLNALKAMAGIRSDMNLISNQVIEPISALKIQSHGVSAGYAKFETFPIWNLPLKHPVNLAYEAATADLDDVNMIDPFHLEAYGETTVNYNRDVEIFPVLRAIFERISGKCPYQSPTDMGVNMAGNCIIDDEVCRQASRMEILRRYYTAQVDVARGIADACQLRKLELVMQQADVTPDLCPAVAAAKQKAEETGAPAGAMVLPDGRVVTGKTSSLLGASAALLLNALKAMAGIRSDMNLISNQVIEPISALKIQSLGHHNPRLHSDEVLIALAISALTNPLADMARAQLGTLRGCDAHFSVIISEEDIKLYKRLGIHVSCEPKYESKRLYHK